MLIVHTKLQARIVSPPKYLTDNSITPLYGTMEIVLIYDNHKDFL